MWGEDKRVSNAHFRDTVVNKYVNFKFTDFMSILS